MARNTGKSGLAVPLDFLLEASAGRIAGYRYVSAYGHNGDADGAEDIWHNGGDYPFMTGATSIEALSGDANDASAGTGARTILLEYLDTNWDEQTQELTLNGVTPVAFSAQVFRINKCRVLTAGSGRVNAGDITLRDSGGGTTRAVMQAGYGDIRQSIFTVPRNHTFHLYNALVSINRPSTARDSTVAFVRQAENGARSISIEISVDGNPFVYTSELSVPVPEKTSFWFRAMYVSAANTDLTAGAAGLLCKLR